MRRGDSLSAKKQSPDRSYRRQGLGGADDIADEGQVEQLIAEAVRRYGRLDILVNNAGTFGGRRIAETSTDTFDEVMGTMPGDVFLLPGRVCADEKAGRRDDPQHVERRRGAGLERNRDVQAWKDDSRAEQITGG